jgi:ribose transport system permease protein
MTALLHTRRAPERASLTSTVQRVSAPIVLAVVVVLGVLVFGRQFANWGNVSNMLVSASFLGIIAVGMTVVIIGGGIDLSVGSVFALGAVVAAYGSRWGSFAGITLPIVVGAAIGLAQGVLVGKARMMPFIVTLAGLLFARGLAFKVSDNGNTTHLIDRDRVMIELGQGRLLGIGIPCYVLALVMIAVGILLNRTRFGQATFAIGGSEEAAELMGLRVDAMKIGAYALLGGLSGLAGMLVAARSSSGLSTIGTGLELEAIAAVVVGGTLLSGGAGSVLGTLTGVLTLTVIQNFINQVGTLRSYHQQIVSGLFLTAVVAAQAIVRRREAR